MPTDPPEIDPPKTAEDLVRAYREVDPQLADLEILAREIVAIKARMSGAGALWTPAQIAAYDRGAEDYFRRKEAREAGTHYRRGRDEAHRYDEGDPSVLGTRAAGIGGTWGVGINGGDSIDPRAGKHPPEGSDDAD